MGANTVGQKYRYDALNRLKKAESFGTGLATNALLSKYSYDQGGNITKIKRHDLSGTIIDSMAYSYTLNGQNKPLTNKLNSVNDLGNATGMPTGSSAYTYDADGRLARDVKESLNMRWTIDNKVRQVQKGNRYIRYWYDATGNRVMKRLHGDTVDYVFRDATGNELERIVRRQNSTSPIVVKRETNIFGSARLGTYLISANGGNDTTEKRTSGKYTYEMTDHLGNVRVTVSDVKTFAAITGGYTLSGNVLSAIDNYPYGMAINSRSFAASTYRFGFNTQEKSPEILQDHNTALFWEYDARTGRRWNLDPKPHISISDFAVNGLNPILAMDPLGDKLKISTGDKQAHDDVKSVAKRRNRKYIKVDPQTGDVTLDFKGLSDKKIQRRLNNDKGLETIGALASAKKSDGSDYNFFYGTQGATGIVPENPAVQGNLNNYFVNISDINTKGSPDANGYYKPMAFVLNSSIQPFSNNLGSKDPKDYGLKPGDGFDGKVFIGQGSFFNLGSRIKYDPNTNSSIMVPSMVEVTRGHIVIHELREVLLRTVHGKTYDDAHNKAGGFSNFDGGGYKP